MREFLGLELGPGVQRQRRRRALLVELHLLGAVDRAGGGEDDPAVERVAEPADGIEVDLARELGVERARGVADERREPDHAVGPFDVRSQAVGVEHVAGDEVDLLQITLLVEQQVVNAHLVAGFEGAVGEPAADVAGAADHQYLGHQPAPLKTALTARSLPHLPGP